MRHTHADFLHASIAGNRCIRIAQNPLHIFIPHGVINHLGPAQQNHIEDGFDLRFHSRGPALHEGNFTDVLALIRAIRLEGRHSGVLVVLLAFARNYLLHLFHDARMAFGRVDAFANRRSTIRQRPTGQSDTQIRARMIVGVLIHHHVHTFLAILLHQRKGLIARAPKPLIVDLEVRQLNPHTGLFTDGDSLVDRLQNIGAFIAHVARIHASMLGSGFAQRHHFFRIRVGSWNVNQPGRKTHGSIEHGFLHQRLHLRNLFRGGRPVRVSHHFAADRIVSVERSQIDADPLFFQRREPCAQVRFRPAAVPADNAGHAVQQIVICPRQFFQIFHMRVDVNESGGHNAVRRVYGSIGRGRSQVADCGNFAALDADVRQIPRVSGAVDYARIPNQ